VRILALTAAAVAASGLLGACSSGDGGDSAAPGQSSPDALPVAGAVQHGPDFPECGGISDEALAEQTQVAGLLKTAANTVGCQWLAGGGILGPHFSFTWFRGSPIGRERKTQELSRTSVEDISIDGNPGFVAIGTDPVLGDNLCEIGIQFDDDFIEWSVSFADKPYPPPCEVAEALTRQSIENAT
jgi:hypothetical protein